ncbi:MAG: hypothetical protein ACLUAR_19135 [Pilosibacter sp.]
MRLLREPYGQCHNPASLLSLSTQLVVGVTTYKKYRRFNRRYSTNCLQKPATGSFVAEMGHCCQAPFAFSKKQQKQKRKDGDEEWQSIIWKQRSSAVEPGAPLWRLPHI